MSDVTHDGIIERIIVLEEKVNNKKLPATIFMALAIQSSGAIWWASDISASVNGLQKNDVSELSVKNYIAEREKAYLEMDNDRHVKMTERVTRVEGSYLYIEKTLARIEKHVLLLSK